MRYRLLLFIFFICEIKITGQFKDNPNDSNYVKLVNIGRVHLEKNECSQCLDAYEKAFLISEHSELSRLRAALCAYMCDEESKWKLHVNFAIEKDWMSSSSILKNNIPEFKNYKDSEIWKYAFDKIYVKKKESPYNEELAMELGSIYESDQELRLALDTIKSDNDKKITWLRINILDSLNLIKIEDILYKYGYPGKTIVGDKSDVAFLVIQHSNLKVQEKYFHLIEKAVNAGELKKSLFALLLDRIKMGRGEKQIYGSQLFYGENKKLEFYAIEDEEHVNTRRAEMGLGSIEEYAAHFGLKYEYLKK